MPRPQYGGGHHGRSGRAKISFHTQSKRGDLFIERILTVVETCRLQGRHIAQFLRQTLQAHFSNQPKPSLVEA